MSESRKGDIFSKPNDMEEGLPLSMKDSLKLEFKKDAEGRGVSEDLIASEFGDFVIGRLNEEFRKQFGFSFSSENLPKVLVDSNLSDTGYARSATDKETGEDTELNIIFSNNIDKVFSGNVMAEELAHFYRFQLMPQSEREKEKIEYMVEEFFGFLGRRLFEKAAKQNVMLADLEDNNRPVPSREMVDGTAKRYGEKIGYLKMDIAKIGEAGGSEASTDAVVAMQQRIDHAKDMAKHIVTHQRGYEFASKIDMDKISNWEKLFSMPNAEARRRFFTDKPDYSNL